MCQIILAPEAKKSLKNLPSQIIERVKDTLRELSQNSYYGKSLKGNLAGRYSARIGDYRIVYRLFFEKREIWVYYIRHRQDGY